MQRIREHFSAIYVFFSLSVGRWRHKDDRKIPISPDPFTLCYLMPTVAETLVAAGDVTIYPSKTAGWVGPQVHLVERTRKYPTLPADFLPPRFWVVTWPAATRVSAPTTNRLREAEKRDPGNEVGTVAQTSPWLCFHEKAQLWTQQKKMKHYGNFNVSEASTFTLQVLQCRSAFW